MGEHKTLRGSGEILLLQGTADSFMHISYLSIMCAFVAPGSSRKFYCYCFITGCFAGMHV